MVMEKDFIPYEQALALKELGFDEHYLGFYYDEKGNVFHNSLILCYLIAPLYQQAFRWFREKYGLNSHIHQESRNNYSYCCGQGYSDEIGGYQDFETYEEAELACLKKLIEIVKQK
jgi:hypothetical protein